MQDLRGERDGMEVYLCEAVLQRQGAEDKCTRLQAELDQAEVALRESKEVLAKAQSESNAVIQGLQVSLDP